MNNKNFDILIAIKSQADIVNVIGHYLKLEKKGNNYIALCPFHNDQHASLSVSPKKQLFNCFSCNTKGDVFKFVKEFKTISFIQAVQEVAQIVNVDESLLKRLKHTDQNFEKYQKYYEINELALRFFKINLWNKNEVEANAYLKKRHLSSAILEQFEIGYATNKKNALILFLSEIQKQASISPSEMKYIGLINPLDDNKDFFINRLIFPIRDNKGNLVGFSGRTISEVEPTKYLNTGSTPIFQKENILYNYYRAANLDNLTNLYVCEGYLDVIALHRVNIKNCIALMGVNLSQSHLETLKRTRNLKEIILCLDNDNAGISATISIAKTLLVNKINFKIVKPFAAQYKDCDDLVNNCEPKKVIEIISSHVDYFTYLIEIWKKNVKNPTPSEILNTATKVLVEIKKYADKLIQNEYVKTLASSLNLNYDDLLNKLHEINIDQVAKEPSPSQTTDAIDSFPVNQNHFDKTNTLKTIKVFQNITNQIFMDEIKLVTLFYFHKKAIDDFDNFSQFIFSNGFFSKLLIKLNVFYLEKEHITWHEFENLINQTENPHKINIDTLKNLFKKAIWNFKLQKDQEYDKKDMYKLIYTIMINANTRELLQLTLNLNPNDPESSSNYLANYKNFQATKKYINCLFEKYNYYFS